MIAVVSDFFYNLRKSFFGIQPEELAPQMPLVYRYTTSDAERLRQRYNAMYATAAHDLGLPIATVNRLTNPILKWLSEYLLYLPASEHFHHIEPGAFYLHCIQTANKAASLACNNSGLFFNIQLEDRPKYQLNFPYAAWIGGLIHDVGKPIADMTVYAVDRDQCWIKDIPTWNPLDSTLDHWCRKHKVRWYRVVFTRNNDAEHHETYIMPFVTRIIDMVPNVSIDKRLVFDFIIGINNPTSKIYNIVKKADALSTQHDAFRYNKMGVFNTPIDFFVQALVDYDFEYSTKTDKPYFISHIGIHIYYPLGIRRILEFMFSKLSKQQIANLEINTDENYWVEMLRNHRFLVADVDGRQQKIGIYDYIYQYIYDVSIVEQGITQSFTCITLTKDRRIPISTKEKELKKVNLVSVDQTINTIEPANKKKIIPEAILPKEVRDITEVNLETDSTNISLKQTSDLAEDVDLSSIQIKATSSKPIPEFIGEAISLEIKNIQSVVSSAEASLIKPTASPLPNLRRTSNSHLDPVQASYQDNDIRLTEFDVNNPFSKILTTNFESHPILLFAIAESTFLNYPELVLFLICLHDQIENNSVDPIDPTSPIILGTNGLTMQFSLIELSLRTLMVSGIFTHSQCQKAKSVCIKYSKSTSITDNIMFKEIDKWSSTFRYSLSKLLLFPIKEKVIPLLESGLVSLNNDEPEV